MNAISPAWCPRLLASISLFFCLALALQPLAAQTKKSDKKTEKKAEPAKKEEKTPPKLQEKLVPPLLELKGHSDWINQVVYSPDGTRLATASRDRTVRVWDAASGKELLTLKDNPGNVRSVAYSPDGKKLASTSGKWDKVKKEWEGEIKIRDAATGKVLQALAGHSDEIERVAFSPDGKWLASASKDKTVIVWDAAGKAVHTLKGHGGEVECVAFSPDSKRLASTSGAVETKDKKTSTEFGELKTWDVASGKELATLKGGTRPLTAVAYGLEGRYLTAGSYDGSLHLWDVATRQEAPALKTPDGIFTVAFNFSDRMRLAVGGWDKAVHIWQWPSGKELFSFQALTFKGHTNSVTSLAFSPRSPHLASASLDQTVKIWNLAPAK